MTGKPTAGPWTFDAQRGQVDCRGGTICADVSWLPNGPLIAAAPDLYESLRTLVERVAHYAPHMVLDGGIVDALAALARARGEG